MTRPAKLLRCIDLTRPDPRHFETLLTRPAGLIESLPAKSQCNRPPSNRVLNATTRLAKCPDLLPRMFAARAKTRESGRMGSHLSPTRPDSTRPVRSRTPPEPTRAWDHDPWAALRNTTPSQHYCFLVVGVLHRCNAAIRIGV